MGGPFGDYRLIRKLGAGGMAEVFLARRPLGPAPKVVCLKRILPHLSRNRELVALFMNEARIAAQFDDPNIARVYETGRVEHRDYIAMEFVAGADLARLRERCRDSPAKVLGMGAVARLIADVCAGLHAAHEAGVVHGDVHPHNVMVTFEGVAKVIDFGVARATTAAADAAPRGTYAYMAPEQLRTGQLDHRADVFAVGTLLFELVAGEPLFRRSANYLTITAVVEDAPTSVSVGVDDAGIAAAIDRIVHRAVAKEPSERYESCMDLAADLALVAQQYSWNATQDSLARPIRELFARERRAIKTALDLTGASSVEDWLVAVTDEANIDWLTHD